MGEVLLFVQRETGDVPVVLPLDATVADLRHAAIKALSLGGHIHYQDKRLDLDATLADSGLCMEARVEFIGFSPEESDRLGKELYEAVRPRTAGSPYKESRAEQMARRLQDSQTVRKLITKGAPLDWKNKNENNNTPLHEAARSGRGCLIEVLCEAGADANSKNSKGATPLHCAAMTGLVARSIEPLLKVEVDLNCRDDEGRTPLHLAVIALSSQCALRAVQSTEILCIVGADVNQKDNKGHTPLDYIPYAIRTHTPTYDTVCPFIKTQKILKRFGAKSGREV